MAQEHPLIPLAARLSRLCLSPKDEATEAEDAEWDPDDDEDPRVK